MGWIASVRCQKFQCEFVARNFALIAPIQPISHQVSCSNETIQNAPKHYKTHQFMSLESNGVDRVRSLQKTLMRFRGTNFFINCTNSTRFAPVSCSNETNPQCTQTVRNEPNLEFSVQWGGWVRSLRKTLMRFLGTNFFINCTSSIRFAPSFVQ